MSLPDSEMLRLRQLARIVNREIRVLLLSDERFHPPLIPDWQGVDFDTNRERAGRVEAIFSRIKVYPTPPAHSGTALHPRSIHP